MLRALQKDSRKLYSTFVVRSPYKDVQKPTTTLTQFLSSRWSEIQDKTACLDGVTGDRRTFGDYHKNIQSVSAHLQSMGVKRGDAISLQSPNHVDFLTIICAAGNLGAIVTPMNPLYKSEELEYQLKASDSSVYIYHEDFREEAEKAASRYGKIQHMIMMGSGPDNSFASATSDGHIADFESMRTSSGVAKYENISIEDTLLMPFSSGTTGLPKGVVLTHENVCVNLLQMDEADNKEQTSETITLSPLPMWHIYGFSVSLLQQALQGRTLVTMKSFDLQRYLEIIDGYSKQGASVRSHIVPPIVLALAKNPLVDKYDMTSLKMLMSAAATLKDELTVECSKRLDCKIKQAWGMSELSPVGTCDPDDKIKAGSIGPLLASTEGKIISVETGEDLPEETEGELCIRGPQVMQGYINQPEKTKETFLEGGWLLTGDLAKYDSDGYFYILDRLKELIKYKGFQVAPAELEDVLMTHSEIIDATVIPVEDEEAGQFPRAYVVKAENSKLQENEVQDYVAGKVAPHKKLRGGVIFTDSIPKTASGKILRRMVVEQDRNRD